MKIAIIGGHLIDPKNGIDTITDILIEGGRIAKIGSVGKAETMIDAKGKIVCPGFIDMHVHLREPGREDKETIATCSRAAAKGGFTTIVGMPNTSPIADDQTVIGYVVAKAKAEAVVKVYPTGSMTKRSESQEMAQVGDLINAGAIAVTDDGWRVRDAGLMHRCFQYLEKWDIPYISHSEDETVAGEGVMHEGRISTELGLPGKPPEAESVGIAREIILAENTKTHVHFTHISALQSVDQIRDAKKRGMRVSCDTCPHYFSLTDEAVRGYDPNAKMSPPLRSPPHLAAIIEGLKDGTIDCITTDHAPHLPIDKMKEFDHCENGIVGLETSVPLAMTNLVGKGHLTMQQLVEKYTLRPASILALDSGHLSIGSPADLTIIDPELEKKVAKDEFESKGRNTPFDGMVLKGWPVMTIVNGRIVFDGKKVIR